MTEKDEVRRKALDRRNRLGELWRKEQSEKIVRHLSAMESYKRAEIILSYSSIRSEVGTAELNQMVLEQGKELYLPKTYPGQKRMSFFSVEDLARLKQGYQGILEPEEGISLESRLERSDEGGEAGILILMPGVAYDTRGYRLGYGGGYYDRYLCRYGDDMTSIFLAFQEQKIPCIPAEAYDRKPDIILTQTGSVKKGGYTTWN